MFDPTMLMCRKFLISVLMSLLLIFWSIPVIAIQAVANLESLFDLWGGDATEYFSDTTLNFISGFMSGTLSTLFRIHTNLCIDSHVEFTQFWCWIYSWGHCLS